jgi:hypothetical protein
MRRPIMTVYARKRSLVSLPLLAVLIAACARAQAASQDDAIADVYTAVALTVSGASPSAAPTPTHTATPTPVPPTSSPYPSPTATTSVLHTYSSSCNGAAYVSDVTVADGEEMAPGETFTKTWELLNTGSCPWSTGYSVVFISGADMQSSSADLDAVVAAGACGDASVELTAPEDEGRYTGYWRLADASGALFGEQFYVQIVVSDDAATVTPTPTTATETPSPTATSAVASATTTSEPTATTEFTPAATPAGATSTPGDSTNHDKHTRT